MLNILSLHFNVRYELIWNRVEPGFRLCAFKGRIQRMVGSLRKAIARKVPSAGLSSDSALSKPISDIGGKVHELSIPILAHGWPCP